MLFQSLMVMCELVISSYIGGVASRMTVSNRDVFSLDRTREGALVMNSLTSTAGGCNNVVAATFNAD